MAEPKTKPTDASVQAFLDGVSPERRRREGYVLRDLMARVTGLEPLMWGDSMVGFGHYHYRYNNGRQGDWFLTGFSPRKRALSVYIMDGYSGYGDLLARLGKHKTAVSCLYITNIDNIDMAVLEDLIGLSVAAMRETYGGSPSEAAGVSP